MLINEGDHDPLEMEPSKNGFSKENLDSNDNLDKKDDEWNLKIKMFFKENGIEDEQNLGDILNKSLEDLGIFYSLNNLIIHSIDNQQQRWEIKNAEKYIENIEEILKEWVVKYNNLQKATIPFFHGIKALISDIEEKFQLFKKNQEIFYILYIFVEFIKRMEKDIELWLMHLKMLWCKIIFTLLLKNNFKLEHFAMK